MCTIVMFARSSNHEQSQRPSFINYDYKGVMCKICSGNLLFENKDFEYSLIKTKNYFIHLVMNVKKIPKTKVHFYGYTLS